MAQQWKELSAVECAQAEIARADIIEATNRLIGEGIDRRVVVAGLGYAVMDTVAAIFGAEVVAPWLDAQAAMARRLKSRP